ncbi:MAG: hypothetical protein RL220_1775 [Bacteroidota bacterium]
MSGEETITESTGIPVPWWPRYFLHISYDGTEYHGWQRQPNGHTVQAEFELALSRILRQGKIMTIGCGRTDAGVHARRFFLHFDVPEEIADPETVVFKINQLVAKDVSAHALIRVHDKAHARYDAYERAYEYCIHQKPDPFLYRYSWYMSRKVDLDLMNEAASILPQYRDFACFSRTGGGQKTSICEVRESYWVAEGDRLFFRIRADRFLRGMVRCIVGTMLDVGRNKMSIEQFREMLETNNRSMAGDSAKPQGLHLTEVLYPYPFSEFTNRDFLGG